MLRRLPAPLKRQLRLLGCGAIARWRRYPFRHSLRSRQLAEAAAASFTTQCTTWQAISTPIPERGDASTCANRRHNLELAIRSLNNRLILPGGAFSLSQQLGEPTEAAGYRAGPVFVKGHVLKDTGGGLCLIATNLYQLFLYAGCRILERHNHSIDAYGEDRFYALGEDAAIAYSTKDLAIRNPFNDKMLLRLRVDEHALHSEILGPGPRPVQTLIQSTVLERVPPASHQQHPGWQVSTSRFIKQPSWTTWRHDYRCFSDYQPC
tara:strand:- start:228 stop:1019 length:792 start_codon:yes stop_codon:yes gene_type:complete